MILGFTTGKPGAIALSEKLSIFRELGCNALELGLINADESERWEAIGSLAPEDLKDFTYLSLHTPALKFVYNHDQSTKAVLTRIQALYERLHFQYAVIHPDRVKDWSVFKDFSFPLAIENMDHNKEAGRTAESLQEIFRQIDAKMVLDVNHCFTNDPSMQVAKELYSAFRERIVEIHVSGYETSHDPLFSTKQDGIIAAIPDYELPIIIESGTHHEQDIRSEYEYIRQRLRNKE